MSHELQTLSYNRYRAIKRSIRTYFAEPSQKLGLSMYPGTWNCAEVPPHLISFEYFAHF